MLDVWQEYMQTLQRQFLDWADKVPCKEKWNEIYAPSEKDQLEAVKRYCKKCPVQMDCMVYALATEEVHGVWGGSTEHERRPLIKQIRASDWRPSHKVRNISIVAKAYIEGKPNEDQQSMAAAQA